MGFSADVSESTKANVGGESKSAGVGIASSSNGGQVACWLPSLILRQYYQRIHSML